MILVNGGGGGTGVTYTPDLNPELSAYRDCYARCRAEGGTVEHCQLVCDPAFTGWESGPYGIPVPRYEGPGFGEAFVGGVAEDLRRLPGSIGGGIGDVIEGATGGSLQSLLILGLIGAALVLAIRLT